MMPRHRRGMAQPVLERLEERLLLAVDFDYVMAPRFGLDLNHNGLIDVPNTASYAQPKTLTFTLTVSGDSNPGPGVVYRWTLKPVSGGKTVVIQRKASELPYNPATLSLPPGTYQTTFQRYNYHFVTARSSHPVNLQDILIVSMGDSYSSGEGNPERVQGLFIPQPLPQPDYLRLADLNQPIPGAAFTIDLPFMTQTTDALWADGADGYYGPTPYWQNMTLENANAHRSTLAASAQYALQLEAADPHTSVTFIFVSQSGATIPTAIGQAINYGKETGQPMPNQLDEIHRIVGSRPIDQLFISLGGNDIGFAEIARQLVEVDLGFDIVGALASFLPGDLGKILQGFFDKVGQVAALGVALNTFNSKAVALPGRYAMLEAAFDSYQINARQKYITEYPDPTRIIKTFTNPVTGLPFEVPWWGPALFDIIPGASVSATESFVLSQLIIKPLDMMVQQAAAANGWTYIGGISDAFIGHGYAAPKEAADGNIRFMRTFRESVVNQGPVGLFKVIDTSGTLHPNEFGHQAIAQRIAAVAMPRVLRNQAAKPSGPLALMTRTSRLLAS